MTGKSIKKSAVRVVVHSFFVVPFLIAAFAFLVFFMWRLLTHEPKGAHDYLTDVKTGSASKRWQSAYELSRLLADPKQVPRNDRFVAQMVSAFEYSQRDPDPRIRQYLARAMGQSGIDSFSPVIRNALDNGSEAVVADAVYALGLIGGDDNLGPLKTMTSHTSPLVRNRAAIALGNLGDPGAIVALKSMLADPEPNVHWNAAVALAKLGDGSGRQILLNLLDRTYLGRFKEVDGYEQTEAMLVAIQAAALLNDSLLSAAIKKLSTQDPDVRIRDAAMRALQIPDTGK